MLSYSALDFGVGKQLKKPKTILIYCASCAGDVLCWKRIRRVLLALLEVNAIHRTVLAVSLNIIYSITTKSCSVFDRNKLSEPKLFPFIKMAMTKTVPFKIYCIKSTYQTSDSFTLALLTLLACKILSTVLEMVLFWRFSKGDCEGEQVPEVSAANFQWPTNTCAKEDKWFTLTL